jgi:ubiquitin carboxyl-terminal hydrolase MINDY-1/2
VLYRRAGVLYTLVTDQVFLHEPTVVWERLEDVDQGAATFVDSAFEHATPVGGDWAGWSPPAEDPAECVSSRLLHYVDSERPTDSRALAMELQKAEDERARREYARQEKERAMQRRRELARYEEDEKRKDKHHKKDKDCLIM